VRLWARCGLSLVLAAAVAVSVFAQSKTGGGAAQRPTAGAPGPAAGPIRVTVSPQLMHLRFAKAVTAPAQLTEDQDVRAHLESPLLATVSGSTQKALIVPSDIDVNLSVRLTQADAQNTHARMQVRIVSLDIDPAFGRQRFSSGEVSHDFAGWPKAGDVLIPAGATLSVPYFGGTQTVGQDALTAKDANASRTEDSYPSHPILQGANLHIALVDTPIDVNNAGSNKLFRAQLTEDVEYRQSGTAPPDGVVKLTKGSDVYLRSYEPDPSAPLGHIAIWTLAFVVVDGKRIPVRGVDIRESFTPGSMAISPDGKRKIPMVLWPLGQSRQYQIAEQQEVSKDGSTLWTYPTTTDVIAPTAATAPTQSTSTARPGTTTSPETPAAPAGATPGLPPDVQQQMDENKRRAEQMKACQEQAVKEHATNPLALARALSACRQAAQPARPGRR